MSKLRRNGSYQISNLNNNKLKTPSTERLAIAVISVEGVIFKNFNLTSKIKTEKETSSQESKSTSGRKTLIAFPWRRAHDEIKQHQRQDKRQRE